MINIFSFRKFMAQVVIAISVTALLICNNIIMHAQQQSADGKFQFVRNGLTAACGTNGETITLEAQRLSGNSSISRVRHSDGRILAEVRRNADIVEFRIANATFALNTASQSFVNFSNENQERLQEFLQSNDATIVLVV